MRVLITGATGLIGRRIVELCKEKNYVVHYLTTDRNKIRKDTHYKGFYWNPDTLEIDEACIEGVDKIIHLAGASVAKRWTKQQQKLILSSRINTAQMLYDLLQNKDHHITQFISASAIGIYPDSKSKLYDEDSPQKANDFLGLVVQEWEKSADKFQTLSLNVAKIRIGLVLAKEAGFFAELKNIIQLYVGSYLGSGNQWQSWIHIDDLARLFLLVAERELTGIFNAVAPNPVQQKYLMKCIAKKMKRKILLPPTPKFVLRAALGQKAEMITSSQLVTSNRWKEQNFIFRFVQVDGAIEDLVK